MKLPAYLVKYLDGSEIVVVPWPNEVAKAGGIKQFEDSIRNDSFWYARLGDVSSRSEGKFDLSLEVKELTKLIAAWEEQGSPKINSNKEPFER